MLLMGKSTISMATNSKLLVYQRVYPEPWGISTDRTAPHRSMWRRYTWLLTFLACHGKSDKLPSLNGWWRVHIYGNLTRKMIMSGILWYPTDRPTWILSLVVAGWHHVFTRLGATKNNAWKRGTIGFTTSCKLGMRTTHKLGKFPNQSFHQQTSRYDPGFMPAAMRSTCIAPLIVGHQTVRTWIDPTTEIGKRLLP